MLSPTITPTTTDNIEEHPSRASFADRFCDDLCKLLLKPLAIDDRLRLECVSKQFQRCIFIGQTRLFLTVVMAKPEDNDDNNSTNGYTVQWIRRRRSSHQPMDNSDVDGVCALFGKCPNLLDIHIVDNDYDDELEETVQLVSDRDYNRLVDTITDNCPQLTIVSLDFRRLTSETFRKFTTKFSNRITRFIDFGDYNGSDDEVDAIIDKLLPVFTHIRELEFRWTYGSLFDHMFAADADGGQCLVNNMTRLHLSLHSDDWAVKLPKLLAANNKTLQSFGFTTYGSDTEQLTKIYRTIADQLTDNLREFRHLEDWTNGLAPDSPRFVMAYKQLAVGCPLLRSIDIYWRLNLPDDDNGQTKWLLFDQFGHFRQLRRLRIWAELGNEDNTTHPFQDPISSRVFTECPNLTSLSLGLFCCDSHHRFGDQFFTDITRHLRSLRSLELFDVELNDRVIDELRRLPKLQSLGLRTTVPISDDQYRRFMTDSYRKIKYNPPSVEFKFHAPDGEVVVKSNR